MCCKRPLILNMDYRRDELTITNRHCNACGTHWHESRQFTRAEWDEYLSHWKEESEPRP